MSLKVKNKIIVSWDDINDLVNNLCEKIKIDIPYITSVTGIKRGGLIPAVMVSHKLGLPYVDIISSNTLVIDDICDSGKTLREGVGVYTATLYFKPHTSNYTPSIWAKEHKGDEFIYFPWERQDAEPVADYLSEK